MMIPRASSGRRSVRADVVADVRRERDDGGATSFLTPRFRFSGWGSPPIVKVGGMPAALAHMFACARYSSACFTSMVDILSLIHI